MLEAGFPDFVFETYTALMAPAKTPPEIVSQLEKVDAGHPAPAGDAREARAVRLRRDRPRTARTHMERVTKEVAMFRDIIEKAGIKKAAR